MRELPMVSNPYRSASGWLDTLGRQAGISVWAHTPLNFFDGLPSGARAFVVALHSARVQAEDVRLAQVADFPTGVMAEAWAEFMHRFQVARDAASAV